MKLTMKLMHGLIAGLYLLGTALYLGAPTPVSAADPPAHITSINVPQGGETVIIFHGKTGPYRIESRTSVDQNAQWFDVPEAKVTEVQTGVWMGFIPRGLGENLAFYRVISEAETITDLKGWTILTQVSAPANKQFFAVGESPVVTVRIIDSFAQGITRDSFSSIALYMYGPQDPQETVTASKMLNASTDRAARPHHYIELKTNPDVQVKDNTLTYRLKPVTDEHPGTYTLSVRLSLASDALQQTMKFANLQIGTAEVENPVVTKTQCAACHEGAISGKMYLHHIDPSGTGLGSWSIDYEPVRSCKSCHNNEGYAAYRDASAPGGRVPDPIVRRVHGVHMGEGLKLDFNTNSVTGNFRVYAHVKFPADVKNCTVCHVDNRWKTDPSRLACGACHDNIWFGDKLAVPAGMKGHSGGTQLNDAKCWACHGPGGEGVVDEGLAKNITDAHKVSPPAFKNVVKLEMTPPANGKFYVTGEAPKATIKISDAATSQAIDPKAIVEPLISTNVAPNEWRRGNLFVSGPRSDTKPVLTAAADTPNPAGYYANNDFRVRLDPAKADPRVTRTADSIIYQLSTITNLVPGTYTAFAEVQPNTGIGGWAYTNFQVGSTNIEQMVASNCTDCHRDTRQHGTAFAVTFTPDICKSCHDNLHQMTAKIGWGNANNGFGAAPLKRRVHGVHFGKYVDKPKEIHARYDYSEVIFPQDVRNCTKCHSQSSTWNEKPSRLACLACHDSDLAIAHATLMTMDFFTPQDLWSGDEVETCAVCHGAHADFSAKKVHAISNPYKPPYHRE